VLYTGDLEGGIRENGEDGIKKYYPISPLFIPFKEQQVEDNG
jgi:hypothetical protein